MIPLPLLSFGLNLLGNWQRILVYAALIAAACLTVWMHGYFKGKAALYEYQGEQAREGARVVVKQGKATEKVVIRYVKIKGKTEIVTNTVEKEVIRYANHTHCLDAGFGWLHDHAATNTVPDAARALDGALGAPTAYQALEAVTDNYARCHRTADKLDALQQWITEQQKVR